MFEFPVSCCRPVAQFPPRGGAEKPLPSAIQSASAPRYLNLWLREVGEKRGRGRRLKRQGFWLMVWKYCPLFYTLFCYCLLYMHSILPVWKYKTVICSEIELKFLLFVSILDIPVFISSFVQNKININFKFPIICQFAHLKSRWFCILELLLTLSLSNSIYKSAISKIGIELERKCSLARNYLAFFSHFHSPSLWSALKN